MNKKRKKKGDMRMDMKIKDRERIGRRVKEIRLEKGITQEELAEMVGIQRASLSRIEAGRFSVGLDILSKIAGILKCRIDIVNE